MNITHIAWRNIARNKRRSILSGSAVAIASFAIVSLFAFLAGMTQDMENNLWTYVTGSVRVRNAEFDRYERLNPMHLAIPEYQELLHQLDADSVVTATSPRIGIPARIPLGGISSDEKLNARGIGVDFAREVTFQDFETTLTAGRLPNPGEREAVVGRDLAMELDVELGDKFTVLSQSGTRGSNAFTLTVTGILDIPVAGLEKTLFMIPLDVAQRVLWLPNQVQEILVKVDASQESPAEVAQRLSENLQVSGVDLSIRGFKDINGLASMITLAAKIYDIIGIVFFLLASTVIINTTIMVIFERMKEIGTLGSMGMTGKQLVSLFFIESLTICLIGSLLGIGLGIGLNVYLGKVGFVILSDAMAGIDAAGVGETIYPVLNFRSTALVFLYSLAVTGLATWWPSRRAAKVTPVEALRHA